MKISLDTLLRTAVLVLALVNQILEDLGHPVLPISDDQLRELITLLVTAGAALWSWWKNNSFTKEAIEADEYYRSLCRKACGCEPSADGETEPADETQAGN